MGKKIDISALEAVQLTDENLDYLKANGARVLPSNPSANGWSAEAIKKQLYKQAEILFAWLKELASAQKTFAEQLDDYLYNFSVSSESVKIYPSLADATTAVNAGIIAEGSMVLVTEGNDLSFYYCSNEGLTALGESFDTFLDRIEASEGDIASIDARVEVLEALFTSGIAKKAVADKDGTDITTYAKSLGHGLTGDGTKLTFTIALKDKNGNVLDTESQAFGGATTSYAGLMTAEDKAKLEGILSGTQTAAKATSATQDGDGNVIPSTYVKKNETTASADEADETKLPKLSLVKSLIASAITGLVNGAPSEYDTLKELADFLANPDNEYFNNIITQLGLKLTKTEASSTYLTKTSAANTYATIVALAALQSALTTLDGLTVKSINNVTPTNGNVDLVAFTGLQLEEDGDDLKLVSYTATGQAELALSLVEEGNDMVLYLNVEE